MIRLLANNFVSVIIPTSNRIEKLLACLDSVQNNNYKDIEIIVVNDDPSSDLRETLKRSSVKLIQHKIKKYASVSRNEGAAVANGDLLFFLDDDNLLDKDAINSLVRKYRELEHVGLLGPIMYEKSGALWFYGCKISWLTSRMKRLPPSVLRAELIQTEVIPNAYLISKELYQTLGGQSCLLPIHGEDADLAFRLMKRGLTNFIYTKAKTVHDYGVLRTHLSENRLYFMVRNQIIIERMHAPFAKLFFFIVIITPAQMFYYFSFAIPRQLKSRSYYGIYIKGLVEGLKTVLGRATSLQGNDRYG